MRVLTLDDAAVRRLADTPTVAAAFPFLKAVKTVKVGCCNKTHGPSPGDLSAAKQSVAGLSPTRRAAFKQLVGADRIVVWVPVDGGVSKVVL